MKSNDECTWNLTISKMLKYILTLKEGNPTRKEKNVSIKISNNIKFQIFKTALSSFSQFKSCLTVQMYIVTLLPFRLILLTIRKIFHEKGKLPKVETGTPKWRKLSKAACCVYNNFQNSFWSTENGFTFNFIRHLVDWNPTD